MTTAAARPGVRGRQGAPAEPRSEPPPPGPLPLLRGFASLRRLTGMYPPGHPMIAQKLTELNDVVQRHLASVRPDPRDPPVTGPILRLDIINGDVHLDGVSFRHEKRANAQFARELLDLGVHSIHVRQGVTPDELRSVAALLWQFKDGVSGEPVEVQLARREVSHITLGRIVPLDTRWRAKPWPDRPTGPLDPAYAQSLALAEQTFETAAAGQGVDLVTVRDLVRLLIDKVARSNAALGQILAVKQYENLTYCHSVNVAMLSFLLGRQLGLDDPTMTVLVEAALLHDIGKTRVPLELLKKPGALDRRERRLVESHTNLGAEILVEVEGLRPLTPTVALEHHRSVKGGGYPDLGDAPPHALTQIVAVGDTYEALTGARAYQHPSLPEQACLIMARQAGERLNSALVKAFVNAITFFPLGSLVRTSHDEVGVVVRTNPTDPLHPVLALVDGTPEGPRREIDTSTRDSSGAYERHIVKTLTPKDGELDLTRFLASDRSAA